MRLFQPEGSGDAADAPLARRRGDRPPASHPVHGSWSATRWQYTSRGDPERITDVVTDLGGSVTLSLGEGTWVLTWAVPGGGGGTIGGTLTIDGLRLDLLRSGAAEPESVQFHLAPDTLALSSDASDWDFGGGAEPAEFVAVLVRL